MSSRPKKRKNQAPPLKKISEQMREWSAMLQDEVARWPGVFQRKMFGMIGFYRGPNIFAALPYTRTIGAEDSFIFKFDRPSPGLLLRLEKDPHIVADQGSGSRWVRFCISSNDDLRDALEWLSLAYEHATSAQHLKTRDSR